MSLLQETLSERGGVVVKINCEFQCVSHYILDILGDVEVGEQLAYKTKYFKRSIFEFLSLPIDQSHDQMKKQETANLVPYTLHPNYQ